MAFCVLFLYVTDGVRLLLLFLLCLGQIIKTRILNEDYSIREVTICASNLE